ncbi:hypothetical protein [Hyphomicrobium sp. 2TAF46]|uniref:hypothetical protein n=1 Tax=Hyphomicrobium sp. 2TAF46 TaxID=3233019 RepID=UPI003F9201B9
MSEIRAFVGHSFTPEDEGVVQAFLNFFNTLQDVIPFKWDHARSAEPKDLTAKVLQKIEDKNVFIGICTRKERLLTFKPVAIIGRLFWWPQISWKTSDWIIQEIGLAIGRELKLILLVEEGVRSPGGLQGNIEYIQFSRGRPDASFVRVLEMLKSASPHSASIMLTAPEARIEQERQDPTENVSEPDWAKPQPIWEPHNYFVAIYRAILRKDEGSQKLLESSFMASKYGADESEVASWLAGVEFLKISTGLGGSLAALKRLSEKHPRNMKVFARLGSAFEFFENHAEAAMAFKQAYSLAEPQEQAIEQLKNCAINFYKAGKNIDAIKAIEEIRLRSEDNELISLRALKQIYEATEQNMAALCITERIMELDPTSIDERFNLAYTHSERGSEEISLYHYLHIPDDARSGIAFNNLGVAYTSFKLPCLAISAFLRAKELHETLAMSNLAYRYMDAGFLDEARRECDHAKSIPDYNNNINLAYARIHDLPTSEQKTLDEILSRARTKIDFLRKFGRALGTPLSIDLSGSWQHPSFGNFTVRCDGSNFEAQGTMKLSRQAFANALAAYPMSPPQEEAIKISINGSMRGSAIEATLTSDNGHPKRTTLLGITENMRTMLIYIEDAQTLRVMEEPNTAQPKVYDLTRAGT